VTALACKSHDPSVENKAIGAYLGLAVGDALGATVEFMTPEQIRDKFGVHDSIIGGGWLALEAGQVTDDTTMSLALGNAILEKGSVNATAVAESFGAWLDANPVDIGHTVKRGIVHYRYSGIPCVPERVSDAGNGACMRTLPVALATYANQDTVDIIAASREQAHVTHNNPLSDAASECIIQVIHAAFDGVEKSRIKQGPVKNLVSQYPEFDYHGNRREMPTGYIVETLQAVMQAFFANDNFEDCLVDVVNRGGDADTTGAIAGMIAGSYYGFGAIPTRWLKQLDAGIFQACEQQARVLLAMDYNQVRCNQPQEIEL